MYIYIYICVCVFLYLYSIPPDWKLECGFGKQESGKFWKFFRKRHHSNLGKILEHRMRPRYFLVFFLLLFSWSLFTIYNLVIDRKQYLTFYWCIRSGNCKSRCSLHILVAYKWQKSVSQWPKQSLVNVHRCIFSGSNVFISCEARMCIIASSNAPKFGQILVFCLI